MFIYVFPLDSKTAYFKFVSTDKNVEYGICEYMSKVQWAFPYKNQCKNPWLWKQWGGGIKHGFKNYTVFSDKQHYSEKAIRGRAVL